MVRVAKLVATLHHTRLCAPAVTHKRDTRRNNAKECGESRAHRGTKPIIEKPATCLPSPVMATGKPQRGV